LIGGGHDSGGEFFLRDRLNPDRFRQFRTDAKPDIADLADEVGLLAEQLDLLVFTEAHFAQTMGDFRRGGKLSDPAGHADAHLGERTDERLRTPSGRVD